MGKSKKKHRSKRKVNNPDCVAADEEATKAIESKTDTAASTFINELLSNIANAEFDETVISSLAALANIATETGGASALVSCGLVRQLGPLLLHNNPHIKEIVAGTLRNISAVGGLDVCSLMVQQDIMTCLSASIKQTSASSFPDANEGALCDDKRQLFLTQVVSLTWNLCESSTTAVKVFNDENLTFHLVKLMKTSGSNHDLLISCAQCLHAATEDNQAALQVLRNDAGFLLQLGTTLKMPLPDAIGAILQAAVAGITYNLLGVLDEQSRAGCFSELLDWVARMLAMDTNRVISSKDEVENICKALNAQQVCLEILSNLLCSEDPENDEWDDVDDDADDLEGATINCTNVVETDDTSMLTSEIRRRDIPTLILQRCATPVHQKDMLAALPDQQLDHQTRAQRVQARALICLGNLLTLPHLESCFNEAEMTSLWTTLTGLLQRNNDGHVRCSDDEFMDAISAALRSVAMQLAKNNSIEFIKEDTIVVISDMIAAAKAESAQTNLVCLLGAIGKLLCQRHNAVEQLQAIGLVFQTILQLPTAPLLLIAEVLDAVFETFADGIDGSVNQALANLQLMQTLKTVSDGMKARVRHERSALGSDFPIIENARINLLRFIKYKHQL